MTLNKVVTVCPFAIKTRRAEIKCRKGGCPVARWLPALQPCSTDSNRKWRGHSPIWQEDTSTLPLSRSPRGLFSVISCSTEKRRVRKRAEIIIHITHVSLWQWRQTSCGGWRCTNITLKTQMCSGSPESGILSQLGGGCLILTVLSGSAADGLISST